MNIIQRELREATVCKNTKCNKPIAGTVVSLRRDFCIECHVIAEERVKAANVLLGRGV